MKSHLLIEHTEGFIVFLLGTASLSLCCIPPSLFCLSPFKGFNHLPVSEGRTPLVQVVQIFKQAFYVAKHEQIETSLYCFDCFFIRVVDNILHSLLCGAVSFGRGLSNNHTQQTEKVLHFEQILSSI